MGEDGWERVYYDGDCGFCQWSVRWLARRDRGRRFRYAPLAGESFRREVPGEQAELLPDSLVVRRADGALLLRSTAVAYLLERLGGGWRPLGVALRLLPRAWRDAAYDFVARHRRKMIAARGSCELPDAATRALLDP